jgi:hypothetical protein
MHPWLIAGLVLSQTLLAATCLMAFWGLADAISPPRAGRCPNCGQIPCLTVPCDDRCWTCAHPQLGRPLRRLLRVVRHHTP